MSKFFVCVAVVILLALTVRMPAQRVGSVPSGGQMNAAQIDRALEKKNLTNVYLWETNAAIASSPPIVPYPRLTNSASQGRWCLKDWTNGEFITFRHDASRDALYIGHSKQTDDPRAYAAIAFTCNGPGTDGEANGGFFFHADGADDRFTWGIAPTNMITLDLNGSQFQWLEWDGNALGDGNGGLPRFTIGPTNSTLGGFGVKIGNTKTNGYPIGIVFQSNDGFTNFSSTLSLTNMGMFTLPICMLTNKGDAIIGEWDVRSMDLKENTNFFRIGYGPTAATTVLDTGTQIASNCTMRAWARVRRTGNTTQHVDAWFKYFLGPTAGGVIPFAETNINVDLAIDNGPANILSLRGAARTGFAITNNSAQFTYLPATR